ncbi:TIGR04222 domain-containing membrane protein [Streptomyces sp. NPDC051452]|uniref:TIGR04222 domain-containing membrane protein n=1 Tax=Streptomyces sp. NPDC051452 TaxID=3365654 RepID=UPI0037887315
MGGTTTIPAEPQAIALLRGGARAAVTVAVLELHLRGVVEADRTGVMRTCGPVPRASVSPLARAVHAALHRPAGIRQLPRRRPVREALGELRAEPGTAGLLRTVLPGPTFRARRALRDLRGGHPLPGPAHRSGLSVDDKLLLVALHGDRALTALAARFTREADLLGRGGATRDVPRHSSGGGADEGGLGRGAA